jgi:hypothetical protein
MAFSKKIREKVYAKTNGHCAYCGCELPKRWHIDHVIPIHRGSEKIFFRPDYMDIGTNDIDNLLPACPKCNIDKSDMSVECYREHILSHYDSLYKAQPMFRKLVNFGIIEQVKDTFEFYFEKKGIEIKNLYEYEIAMATYWRDQQLEVVKKWGSDSDILEMYSEEVEKYNRIIEKCKRRLGNENRR